MSGATTRMARHEAIEIAKRFVALIEDCTQRLVVAGSIRRRLALVGDIEIVAAPKLIATDQADMFGNPVGNGLVDLLHDRLERLVEEGRIQKRTRSDGRTFWGPAAKFLTFDGAPIDLFTPDADRFAWILAIRTGPADFSNALVTPVGVKTHTGRRGLLPEIYKSREGWLTWRTSGERIKTTDERRLFEILGIAWKEPWERS